MKVALGQFARSEIEAQLGPDLEAGVRTALQRYALDLESGRETLPYPSFRRQQPRQPSGVDLELSLKAAEEAEVEAALEGEVRRQNVSLEQLVTHAVFLCLADLDRAEGQE